MAIIKKNTLSVHPAALYLALPTLAIVVFFIAPLCGTMMMSLQDYSQSLYAPQFIGLKNYSSLLSDPVFLDAVKHTVIFLLGVVPCMVVLPVFLALLVNTQLRGIQMFRSMIYLPVVISLAVVGITWRWLYAQDGLLNWVIQTLGLPKVDWLVNPDIALFSIMVVVIWKGLPYYMMMYLAHLQQLPQSLQDAAKIDGAGGMQQLWHIIVPHLKPSMTMVAIISSIASLKVFTEMYVMTRGGPVGATKTLVYFIYEQAFENLNLGIACAAGLMLMLVLVAFGILDIISNKRLSLRR
ncbi:MAG: sugar ABC transporter permease [Cyanobacteria bacterium P01_H01_bin.74]